MDFSSALQERRTGRYERAGEMGEALLYSDGMSYPSRTELLPRDVRLQEGLSFATGIAVGYLLGRALGAGYDRWIAADSPAPEDVAAQIRERPAVEGAGQPVPGVRGDRSGPPGGGGSADRLLETPPQSATVPDAVAGDDAEQAVETLFSPAVRGMPMLGVGTHNHATYDDCYETVGQALRTGYRHVDTTVQREAYYNEPAVGDAIADAEVPREDVFVATKVNPADLDARGVRQSAKESLERLGMNHVDLLYPHWPTGDYEPIETMGAFADLVEKGHTRRIGVSNFSVDLLEEAIEASPYPIFANQVEMHPLFPQPELRAFCARKDVNVELVAYSPLARGDIEDVDELQAVADKHGASLQQVSLAWLREKGVTAIPGSTNAVHLRENWLSLGVDLDDEDVSTLDGIEERRRVVDPDDAPWNL